MTRHDKPFNLRASVECGLVYFMVAYVIGQTIYIFMLWFVMVALCNRADHDIFMLFLSSFSSSSFSSPNLSGRRLDVYHTFAHGVALVQI